MRITLLATILLVLAACSRGPEFVEVHFELRSGDQPISCETTVNGVGLTDMRFYVSDLTFMADDGSSWPATFEPDDIWQTEAVSLIDLENGQGACLNGSDETNASLRARHRGPAITGLSFEISVPDVLNHGDPVLATPPLSYTPMHWHWASGYKFLRAGIEKGPDSYFLHLGSSRCEGTIGNILGCKSANRAVVTLADFVPARHTIVVDVGELFADIDMADGHRSECMSGPANDACRGPFGRLGLDFDTGNRASVNSVFRLGTR